MHCKSYDVVATCSSPLEPTAKGHRARPRAAEEAFMQPKSSGKCTSPPTARVWVNATWSPDAPAKKRTLSLSAAERGVLSGLVITVVPHVRSTDKTSMNLLSLSLTCWLLTCTNAARRAFLEDISCPGNAPVSDYPAEDQYQLEQREAELCDSGLPDTEVCDVLHIPPRDSEVVSEAWSRG